MSKGKLHELLAVEPGLKKVAREVVEEGKKTFAGRQDHFMATHKVYEPFEEDKRSTESFEETHEMVTTVREKLQYILGHLVPAMDASLQKEATNQVAKADLVLDDGTVLAKDLPATFLLGLETECKTLRDLLICIPTLPPGKKWVSDPTASKAGVYGMDPPETTFRTRQEIKHKVLYEATDRHPAQIEKWTENVNCGKFIKNVQSGMISPSELSAILGRLDQIEKAAKKARQRANCEEVVSRHVGESLTSFLLGE